MEFLTPEHCLIGIGAAAVLGMLAEYLRRKRKLRAMAAGSGSGIAALLLLHFYGASLGCTLPLNVFTLCAAAVGGIPGTGLLWLLNRLLPA